MLSEGRSSGLYHAYGLLIESDFALGELLDASAEGLTRAADVRVFQGDVGLGADGGRLQVGPYAWCASDEFWLEVPGVARFLARHGSNIIVQAQQGADEDSIRLFLLGSMFGMLLAQRDFLVLHGNAIRIGNQCLMCVGSSGIGKSTLAAGFLDRGYSILADDVVPIDESGCAMPAFPRIKLWRDAAERLGVDITNLHRLRPQLDKYNYPLGSMFERDPQPVRWIYLLDKGAVDTPQFLAFQGMHRFMPLFHNTYRRRFIESMGRKASYLKRCGQLAASTHIVKVTRPASGFDLDGLIDAMLSDAKARG